MFKIYRNVIQLVVISTLSSNTALAESYENRAAFHAHKFLSSISQVASETSQSEEASISPRASKKTPKKVNFGGTWKGLSYVSVNSCGLSLGSYANGLVTDHRVLHKGTGILLTARPSGETFGGSTAGKSAFSVYRSESSDGCTLSTKVDYTRISGNKSQIQFSLLSECGSDQCLLRFKGAAKKK